MIVKCPDCGQELTDTTLLCPMCGCHIIGKKETARQITLKDKSLQLLYSVFSGKYSPYRLFFHFKGGLNRLQFFFSLIYLFLIFYLCHTIRRKYQLEIPVKGYYTSVITSLVLLDLSVLWKRLYAVDWKRKFAFPIILLLLIAVATRIELVSEISLLIFLILHSVLFATPELPEK